MYAIANPGSEAMVKNELCWYAVVSRSRHEKLAAAALANTGITAFLPLVSEMHSWSDRRKLVDVPLFPGYVFVQIPNSPEAQLRCSKQVVWSSLLETATAPCPSRIRKSATSGRYWPRNRLHSPSVPAIGAAGENSWGLA